ncbi:MAG: ribbon-helix-helix domain-containing protein [Patescibacteria group bacterium]
MRKVLTISLPTQTIKTVNTLVSSGGYASTSELFRELIRAREAQEKKKKSFNVPGFLRAVKTHAKKGAHKDLSSRHDHYLYGA